MIAYAADRSTPILGDRADIRGHHRRANTSRHPVPHTSVHAFLHAIRRRVSPSMPRRYRAGASCQAALGTILQLGRQGQRTRERTNKSALE
jgi:hypothetical protein